MAYENFRFPWFVYVLVSLFPQGNDGNADKACFLKLKSVEFVERLRHNM